MKPTAAESSICHLHKFQQTWPPYSSSCCDECCEGSSSCRGRQLPLLAIRLDQKEHSSRERSSFHDQVKIKDCNYSHMQQINLADYPTAELFYLSRTQISQLTSCINNNTQSNHNCHWTSHPLQPQRIVIRSMLNEPLEETNESRIVTPIQQRRHHQTATSSVHWSSISSSNGPSNASPSENELSSSSSSIGNNHRINDSNCHTNVVDPQFIPPFPLQSNSDPVLGPASIALRCSCQSCATREDIGFLVIGKSDERRSNSFNGHLQNQYADIHPSQYNVDGYSQQAKNTNLHHNIINPESHHSLGNRYEFHSIDNGLQHTGDRNGDRYTKTTMKGFQNNKQYQNHDPTSSYSNSSMDHCDFDSDSDLSGTPICKTSVVIDRLSFQWDVYGFRSLRKLAALKALPCKDRLVSQQFGSKRSGFWHCALFPYADRESRRHVSLYLFSDDTERRRVAEFRLVLLDHEGNEIAETALEEKARVFTPENTTSSALESSSWGWHEFLTVPYEESLQQYFIKQHSNDYDKNDGTLSIKANVTVYSTVEEVIGSRPLMNVFYQFYQQDDDYKIPLHHQTSFASHLQQMYPTAIHKLSNNEMTNTVSPPTQLNSYKLVPLSIKMIGEKKRVVSSWMKNENVIKTNEELSLQASPIGFPPAVSSESEAGLGCHNDNICISNTSCNVAPAFVPPVCHGSTLAEDLKHLLSFCACARDVGLICSDGQKVWANSLVLAARSPVFCSMIYSEKFNSNQQDHSNLKDTISVQACSSVVQCLVEFLETDQCRLTHSVLNNSSDNIEKKREEDLDLISPSPEGTLTQVLQLWILSDFYLIAGLYRACVVALVRILSIDNAYEVSIIAQKLQCGALIDATDYFLQRLREKRVSRQRNKQLPRD